MESLAEAVHLPPLAGPHEREVIGEELQTALAQLVNLSLIGKRLHWSVVGPDSTVQSGERT